MSGGLRVKTWSAPETFRDLWGVLGGPDTVRAHQGSTQRSKWVHKNQKKIRIFSKNPDFPDRVNRIRTSSSGFDKGTEGYL